MKKHLFLLLALLSVNNLCFSSAKQSKPSDAEIMANTPDFTSPDSRYYDIIPKIDGSFTAFIDKQNMTALFPQEFLKQDFEKISIVELMKFLGELQDEPKARTALYIGNLQTVWKMKILHPINLATWAYYKFIQFSPLPDGNKRKALAMANLVLLISGYFPMGINHDPKLAPFVADKDRIMGLLTDDSGPGMLLLANYFRRQLFVSSCKYAFALHSQDKNAKDGKCSIKNCFYCANTQLLRSLSNSNEQFCRECGLTTQEANVEKLMLCGECNAMLYCSKACQEKSWATHKHFCARQKEPLSSKKNDEKSEKKKN